MRCSKLLAAMAVSALLGVSLSAQNAQSKPSEVRTIDPGSEACASCHAEIYKSYGKTVMARASGLALEGLVTGEFEDKESGVRYRVYQRDGHAWMSYEREKGERSTRGARASVFHRLE